MRSIFSAKVRYNLLPGFFISLLSICLPFNAYSSDDDPHKHHKMMMKTNNEHKSSQVVYNIPDIHLIDQHGKDVNTKEILNKDTPFIVSYIFTTCATICPILTATIASAQDELLSSKHPPTILSISIDPEEDTPDRLLAYSSKYNASDNWIFLTGTLDDIVTLQRSMDAYRGSKLNHEPITFIKAQSSSKWTRLEGFTSASTLVNEYRKLTESN